MIKVSGPHSVQCGPVWATSVCALVTSAKLQTETFDGNKHIFLHYLLAAISLTATLPLYHKSCGSDETLRLHSTDFQMETKKKNRHTLSLNRIKARRTRAHKVEIHFTAYLHNQLLPFGDML